MTPCSRPDPGVGDHDGVVGTQDEVDALRDLAISRVMTTCCSNHSRVLGSRRFPSMPTGT
jgi:hypothetical protein